MQRSTVLESAVEPFMALARLDRPPRVVADAAVIAWPRISVIIPSFNHGAYIEHALQSVIAQQYPDLELIVIDGGSTDGTVAILERYAGAIRHWQSRRDRGPSDALNTGFARATGAILGFLNADDFYLPGCLMCIARAFVSCADADVISGHGRFAEASGRLGLATFSDRWNRRRFVYGTCVLVQPATFFRRDAFVRAGGFRNSGSVCWDMELWADLARSGARFSTIDACLAAFRLHGESITGRRELGRRRRADARAVMEAMRGRPESSADRVMHLLHRLAKFSRHPVRTLRQRLYFRATLGRWSL